MYEPPAINKIRGCTVQRGVLVNNTVLYITKLIREEILKDLIRKKCY